ncbi:MAG TPA: putative toxin-antitoxin system toxin component, PIN family [Xanthomonadales bacterium]|nr:putative toxin-antitoxin system toxin component, PIN family [Xanthomonadales bacterium]
MTKVVVDTVVFVRGLINPFSYWGKLLFKHNGKYRLFVSKPIVFEILEVLDREEIVKKFRLLKGMDKSKVIEIISQAEVVVLKNIEHISRDSNDDKFIATAKAAKVDYIISEDRDLLDIKEFEGIKIITAEEFIKIVEK